MVDGTTFEVEEKYSDICCIFSSLNLLKIEQK